MPYFNSGKNLMLEALRAVVTHVSLHSAEPNASGSNEISGGDPAYARGAVTIGAAADGEMVVSADVELNVPPSTTVAWVGFWTAATGGTIHARSQVPSEVFGSQGTFTVKAGTRLDLNLDLA